MDSFGLPIPLFPKPHPAAWVIISITYAACPAARFERAVYSLLMMSQFSSPEMSLPVFDAVTQLWFGFVAGRLLTCFTQTRLWTGKPAQPKKSVSLRSCLEDLIPVLVVLLNQSTDVRYGDALAISMQFTAGGIGLGRSIFLGIGTPERLDRYMYAGIHTVLYGLWVPLMILAARGKTKNNAETFAALLACNTFAFWQRFCVAVAGRRNMLADAIVAAVIAYSIYG